MRVIITEEKMKLRAIVVLLKDRSNVQKEGFCNCAYAVGRFEGQASLVFLPSMRRTRSIWDPEKEVRNDPPFYRADASRPT